METKRPKSPPSMVKLLLWTLLWLVMGFWAIVGPLFAVLAAVSFLVDITPVVDLGLFGQPVRTTEQKIVFLALSACLGLVGIGFFWLRRRGYFKSSLERN